MTFCKGSGRFLGRKTQTRRIPGSQIFIVFVVDDNHQFLLFVSRLFKSYKIDNKRS